MEDTAPLPDRHGGQPKRRSAQQAHQMAPFILNLVRAGYRPGNFRVQDFTEATAQPVDLDAHGAFAQAPARSHFRVRNVTVSFEERPHAVKKTLLPDLDHFGPQSVAHLFEQRQRPLAFEDFFGCGVIHAFTRVAQFEVARIQG